MRINLSSIFVGALALGHHIATAEEETESRVNCMDILYKGCLTFNTFTSAINKGNPPKCKVSSTFGPIISKCSDPNNYMFNRAMTFHGQVGATVKSLCTGKITVVGKLHDGKSDLIITNHRFSQACYLNGKKHTHFDIHYGHAVLKSKKKGNYVQMNEDFATLVPCKKCKYEGREKAFALIMLKIGGVSFNPYAIFTNKSLIHPKRPHLSPELMRNSMRVEIYTDCNDATVNSFEIKCGGKNPFHLNFNRRIGYPSKDIGKKPHKMSDKKFPYIDPPKEFLMFGTSWGSYLFIPDSYHRGQCCTVYMRDIWGKTKTQNEMCPGDLRRRLRKNDN